MADSDDKTQSRLNEGILAQLEHLGQTVEFLVDITELSLRIAIRQAHILDHVANKAYGEKPTNLMNFGQIEKEIKLLRDLFDAQKKLMMGE